MTGARTNKLRCSENQDVYMFYIHHVCRDMNIQSFACKHHIPTDP